MKNMMLEKIGEERNGECSEPIYGPKNHNDFFLFRHFANGKDFIFRSLLPSMSEVAALHNYKLNYEL